MGLRLGTGSRGSVGLDIDSGYLAAVEVRDGRIARAVSADLPAGAFADGEVNDPAALGAQLKDFVKSNDLPRRVRLGVANQQIAVRSMDLPAIEDQAELAAAVRFQASDTIAMPLEEAVLDYQVVGESTGPEGSPRVRVVVAAARESMVNLLVEAARGAGLRPLGIDLSAFALVRALSPRNGSVPQWTRGTDAGGGGSCRTWCRRRPRPYRHPIRRPSTAILPASRTSPWRWARPASSPARCQSPATSRAPPTR